MGESINDELVDTWESHEIDVAMFSVQLLPTEADAANCCCCGIDVPRMMESWSTHTLIGIGGDEGSNHLKAGGDTSNREMWVRIGIYKRRVPFSAAHTHTEPTLVVTAL